MNRFTLRLLDKEAEAEYTRLKAGKIAENTNIVVGLLVIILIVTGIPAAINQNFLAFGTITGLGAVLVAISFLRGWVTNYKQFIILVLLAAYQYSRPFFIPTSFSGSTYHNFLTGYNVASFQLMLITRFPDWKQKILGVLITFVLRFVLTGHFDKEIFQGESFLRNILPFVFVLYIFYCNEKTAREVFLSYYTSREKLNKFKQLVVQYLDQSIVILNPITNKCLFFNKSFVRSFRESELETMSPPSFETMQSIEQDELKTKLGMLKIEKDSIRNIETLQPYGNFSDITSFNEFLDKICSNSHIQNKTISLSASSYLNNSYVFFEVIVTKLKWEQEDAIAIVLNDITYQQKLLSLKISNENKDKIIATVSHELRTPLNGIIGILEIAQSKIDQLEVTEYLDLCKDNAKLLLGLVNSILDIHQIRQGKLKLNVTKVNLHKVLKDITRLFHFQCEQKSISLNIDIKEGITQWVCTDENRLKQILINLVGNAIKFTSQGGITLEVCQDQEREECLRICVCDTGIGIKEEDMGKLFKMYSKLQDGESVNENGVGLGLMISNALAVLLGGKTDDKGIEVESTFGKGTKFQFSILKQSYQQCTSSKNLSEKKFEGKCDTNAEKISDGFFIFPQDTQEVELYDNAEYRISQYVFIKTEANSNEDINPILEKGKSERLEFMDKKIHQEEILAVDDNPFNLMVVENLLKGMGYIVKKAKSGKEAIEEVKAISKESKKFKVILMDCNMPIMDGYETTRVLKEMMHKGEVNEMPIVALTASNAEEDIKKCFESGMSDYLMKPLLAPDLEKVFSKFD